MFTFLIVFLERFKGEYLNRDWGSTKIKKVGKDSYTFCQICFTRTTLTFIFSIIPSTDSNILHTSAEYLSPTG